MLAIVVGQSVSGGQVERGVAVVKQTHCALLIRRVRVRVGKTNLDAVTQSLFNVSLQRVVGGDTNCRIGLRLGGITDEGDTQVHISAFKGLQIWLPVGQEGRSESGGGGGGGKSAGGNFVKTRGGGGGRGGGAEYDARRR